MRILVIAPNPNDGTSYYRALGPISKMSKMYPDVSLKVAQSGDKVFWHTVADVDVVFMQRPFGMGHVSIAKLCNRYRVPLVVDYDDNYFAIAEDNPAFEIYDNQFLIDTIRHMIDCADEAWFGTKYLMDVMGVEKTPSYHVPNAIDTDLFPVRSPRFKNYVVWRGGGSHVKDLEMYKDPILELINEHKDHEFLFMGHCPQFVIDKVDSSRFKEVRFSAFPIYMSMLMEISGKCIILPMQDNPFNKSRGDSSFLEGAVAGIPVVAPAFMPSFGQHTHLKDIYQYGRHDESKITYQEDFYNQVSSAIDNPSKQLVENAQKKIYTLREAATLRYERFHSLLDSHDSTVTPNTNDTPFTDDEEYMDTTRMGITLHNETHRKTVKGIVKMFMEEFEPKFILDVGCGNGSFLAEFLKQEDVIAHGVDLNPFWKKEWDDMYPDAAGYFIHNDFMKVKFEDHVDILFCVEVMEHLDEETVHKWIKKFSDIAKMVVFTSTPYSEGPAWDSYWGHKSIKPMDHWVELFKKYGFTMVRKQQPPAPWGMLFINTKF